MDVAAERVWAEDIPWIDEGFEILERVRTWLDEIDRLRAYIETAEDVTIDPDILMLRAMILKQWIPVTKLLPEDGQYLVRWRGIAVDPYVVLIADRYKNEWYIDGEPDPNVTHWMPLPDLPKGDDS